MQRKIWPYMVASIVLFTVGVKVGISYDHRLFANRDRGTIKVVYPELFDAARIQDAFACLGSGGGRVEVGPGKFLVYQGIDIPRSTERAAYQLWGFGTWETLLVDVGHQE